MNDVPPVDQIVEQLIPLWSTALRTPADADSDFFALGGNSLAAVAIATEVAERYEHCPGIELAALQAVFQCPNLAAMAEELHTFMLAPASR